MATTTNRISGQTAVVDDAAPTVPLDAVTIPDPHDEPANLIADAAANIIRSDLAAATAAGVKVIREFTSAVNDLGCIPDVLDAGSATINNNSLVAYLDNTDPTKYERQLLLPAGALAISSKLTTPNRGGGVHFRGAGGGICDLFAETHYQPDGGSHTFGSPHSRLVWLGAANATMIESQAQGDHFSNLHFQGAWHATDDTTLRSAVLANGPAIGLLIQQLTSPTYPGEGGTPSGMGTGEAKIESCTFSKVQTGIQLGTTDHGDQADHTKIAHCKFQYCDRAVTLRCWQSLGNSIEGCYAYFTPVFCRVYRGGKTSISGCDMALNATAPGAPAVAKGVIWELMSASLDRNVGSLWCDRFSFDAQIEHPVALELNGAFTSGSGSGLMVSLRDLHRSFNLDGGRASWPFWDYTNSPVTYPFANLWGNMVLAMRDCAMMLREKSIKVQSLTTGGGWAWSEDGSNRELTPRTLLDNVSFVDGQDPRKAPYTSGFSYVNHSWKNCYWFSGQPAGSGFGNGDFHGSAAEL